MKVNGKEESEQATMKEDGPVPGEDPDAPQILDGEGDAGGLG